MSSELLALLVCIVCILFYSLLDFWCPKVINFVMYIFDRTNKRITRWFR